MPLNLNAKELIRQNLEGLNAGRRVPRIAIGKLTFTQLQELNAIQASRNLPLSIDEVLFVGRHVWMRRMQSDNYTVDDAIDQIESAMSSDSHVLYEEDLRARRWATILRNPIRRADRYGNQVTDEAVLECTSVVPNPDLFSVIPKGDRNRPPKRIAQM